MASNGQWFPSCGNPQTTCGSDNGGQGLIVRATGEQDRVKGRERERERSGRLLTGGEEAAVTDGWQRPRKQGKKGGSRQG